MPAKCLMAILLFLIHFPAVFTADEVDKEIEKAHALFKISDLNGDNKVTKEEMDQILQGEGGTAYAAKFGKLLIMESFDKLVASTDEDRDGAISQLELDAAMAAKKMKKMFRIPIDWPKHKKSADEE